MGWNVVTSYLDSASRNLTNGQPLPDHDARYAICEEYMTVVYKLWNSSWRSDAVQLNKTTGIYTDPSLVRPINHQSPHFHVPGPHICQPSPQRTPLIYQAGTSKAGKNFAAQHAEAVFVSQHSPAAVAGNISEIRRLASETYGRDPADIKVLAKFAPVLGRTQAEADAKYADLLQYGDYDGALALFGGWTGVDMAPYGDDEELRMVGTNAIKSYIEGLVNHAPEVNGGKWTKRTLAEHIMVGGLGATCVGTPARVADEMERWIVEGGVDGFNIVSALSVAGEGDADVVVVVVTRPTRSCRGLSSMWRSCWSRSCSGEESSGAIIRFLVGLIGRTFIVGRDRESLFLVIRRGSLFGGRRRRRGRRRRGRRWRRTGCRRVRRRVAISRIGSDAIPSGCSIIVVQDFQEESSIDRSQSVHTIPITVSARPVLPSSR